MLSSRLQTGVLKKTAIAMILLLVLEFLYVDGDPLSFGLPFRSVQYKPVDFPGHTLSTTEIECLTVFRVDLVLLAFDVSVAVLLVLLLVRCVPSAILVSVTKGCVLGSVAGSVFLGPEGLLPEPWFSVAVALVLFVIIPFTVYALSLGHKHQKTVIIIIACVTLLACIRAGFIVEGLRRGIIDEMSINPRAILYFAALSSVLVCLCFVLMVLHKKVLPAIWPKKRAILPTDVVQSDNPQIPHPSGQMDTRCRVREAVLYTLLLVITIYVGWHFMTIREMGEEGFVVSDAINSEFERLKVPFGWYSFMSPRGDSELLKPGWSGSYQVEIHVKDKDTYVAEIKKSILVPWIQVKIHKKESAVQADNPQTSNE